LPLSPGTTSVQTALNRVLSGREFDAENIAAICRKLASQYPIDKKHLTLNHDTSTGGIWHCSKQESLDSARIFDRTNENGHTGPYYNYMDTAAAALAPFKPELIEMLVQADDTDPMNPVVVMNKGHLLAQATFFIGPVNYYCTIRGKRHCKAMNTGDSCLITPYVPHSFTTRDSSQYAAIVAITFSTGVRDVLSDLVLQNTAKLIQASGDAREPATVSSQRRARFGELRGFDSDGIEGLLADAFPNGVERTQAAEDEVLSAALNVPVSFFTVPELTEANEVTYAYAADYEKKEAEQKGSATATIKRPLASAMHLPEAGGYEWKFSETAVLDCQYFNYIYNHGNAGVTLETSPTSTTTTLAPGDSCVLKPFTKVVALPVGPVGTRAELIVVKVAGCVRQDVLDEMSTFAAEGRNRMAGDLDQWW
jgi:methylphosphonate synthase